MQPKTIFKKRNTKLYAWKTTDVVYYILMVIDIFRNSVKDITAFPDVDIYVDTTLGHPQV